MQDIKPPSPLLMLMEGRVIAEAAQLMLQLPLLRRQAEKGDGEPVLVLPGFMTDDRATFLLRDFLQSIGYDAHPWGLGVNRLPMHEYLPPLRQMIHDLHAATGQKVKLMGWSRGGILSRELARDDPALIDRVVTVGSPVKGGTSVSSIGRWVQRETGLSPAQMSNLMLERNRHAIRVPVRAIFSRSDGIVAWQACIDETTPDIEHHEVHCSHAGMGSSAEVFRLLPGLLR